MEQMNIYANTIAYRVDKKNGAESEPEEHWPQAADTPRQNLQPKIIYTLLGICIVVSVLSLVLAIVVMVEMSEMKGSDAGFRMEISQWKSNVTGDVEKATSSLFNVQAEIAHLKGLTGDVEKATSLLADVQAEIDLLKGRVFSCPEQWTKFKQSCYQISSSTNTWVEAQRSCASADAHLVVINNAEEQNFLKQNWHVLFWIGLSDSASEGDWRWVDGTDYTSSVKFWGNGQPDGQKDHDEDCAVVSEDGSWHDWPCDSKHPVMCEKPAQ